MDVKTKYKVGDIVYLDSNVGPRKFLISQIIIDENDTLYSNGRGVSVPEEAVRKTKQDLTPKFLGTEK